MREGPQSLCLHERNNTKRTNTHSDPQTPLPHAKSFPITPPSQTGEATLPLSAGECVTVCESKGLEKIAHTLD